MKHLFLFIIISFPFSIYGQIGIQQECGSEPTKDQIEFMESFNRFAFSSLEEDTTVYIAVSYFIARRTDSTGGLDPEMIPVLTDQLNDAYENAGVQFYSCGEIEFIDSTEVFDFERAEESGLCGPRDVRGTMNVYFFNSVKSSSGSGLCGYAYFPGGRDRIIMNNACALNGSTYIHEVGHFFSLYHTHGKTNSGTTDELVDGSNCDIAGDNICDTPADPNLNGKVNRDCEYTGSAMDANGEAFMPDPNNIMSYSRKACRDYLSPGQLERVRFSARYHRPYFEPCCPDTLASVFYSVIPAHCDMDNGRITIDSLKGERELEWVLTNGQDTLVDLDSLTNDEYFIQVKDRVGCNSVDSVQLNRVPSPFSGIQDSFVRYCSEDTIYFPELILADSNWLAIWQDSNGIEIYPDTSIGLPMKAGEYFILLQDTIWGCRNVDPVFVIEDLQDLHLKVEALTSNFQITLKDLTEQEIENRNWLFEGETLGDNKEWDRVVSDTGWYSYCLQLDNICGSDSLCDSIYVAGYHINLKAINPLCPDSSGAVQLEITGDSIGYQVSWTNESGSSGDTLEGLEQGRYVFEVLDENGSLVIDSISLKAPEPFGYDTLFLQASTGADGIIDLAVSGGTPPYTYNWSNGDTNKRISGLAPGFYECEVYDVNGCYFLIDPIEVESISYAGFKHSDLNYSIFPVPVSDQVTVALRNQNYIDEIRFTCIDNTGRKLVSGLVESIEPGIGNEIRIDCSDWSAGVYFLNLYSKQGQVTQKFIKL